MSGVPRISLQEVEDSRVSRIEGIPLGVDPIADKLLGDAIIPYMEIKGSTRKALVDGLRGVKRWSTTPYKMDPDWRENNLEHVLGLLDWANELAERFPNLKQQLCQGNEENWTDFCSMLVLHDIGEIVVGDICRSDPRFEKKHGILHKRKESYAAHLLLGDEKLVGDQSAKLRALYHRFGKKDQRDRLVMLGNTFDKGQATANVARHQVPFNLDDPNYSLKKSTTKNLTNTLGFMVDTMGSLQDNQARQELATFVSEKVLKAFDELKMKEVDETLANIRRQFAIMGINL